MKNFQGRKIAVFDAEIKKRIEDCSNGWNSHDEMGISVLVIFDYATMRYRVAKLMYQEGRFTELVDYCIEDVRIEKTLFEFAATYGYVIRGGKPIQLTNPDYGQS